MLIRTLAVAAVLAITGHSAFADSFMPTEKLPDDVKVATPFGIAIGKTTCAEAAVLLGGRGFQYPLDANLYIVMAAKPGQLYPGANLISARCLGNLLPVGSLGVAVSESKDGPGANEAAVTLASKYMRTRLGQTEVEFKVDGGDTLVYLRSTFAAGARFSIVYETASVRDMSDRMRNRQIEEKARAAKEAADGAAAQRSKVL